MKQAKRISLLVFLFLVLSSPCHAEGYMSMKVGTSVKFLYVQTINVISGSMKLSMDVTDNVPHELQRVAANTKILVVD